MSVSLASLIRDLQPESTVLLFGSGSSIPSKAPSTSTIIERLGIAFDIPAGSYNLREMSTFAEGKSSRRQMIEETKKLFVNVRPTGGLMSLPHYDWKSIFTTNYDNLIEQSYVLKGKEYRLYSSNFDFTIHDNPSAVKIFKLHGTIEKDIAFGDSSRMIITESDYDHTDDYRENLFDRLKADLISSHLLIVGHSLADPDIRDVINRAALINAKSGGTGKISLLMYSVDENRASLWEGKGIQVCFAGIDEFFAALSSKKPPSPLVSVGDEAAFFCDPQLSPVTIDVSHATEGKGDASAIFNGWPAEYCDIAAGLTFKRSAATEIVEHFIESDNLLALILGASGVGKTTAARQAMYELSKLGFVCWEHKTDCLLSASNWIKMAQQLVDKGRQGILFIDESDTHLFEINELVDLIVRSGSKALKLILISTRSKWYPRVKSPHFFRLCREWMMSKLGEEEIDRLLHLIDSNERLRVLVEPMFSGFSRYERRRRLIDRCEKDFFVCLRNIFGTENLDHIILREYAGLDEGLRDIFKYVSAMDNAGVRVHRQLIVRLLGIKADAISSILDHLTDIIHETEVNPKEGIYAWRTRHAVISSIIARNKFSDLDKMVELFERIISSVNPTFDIEIRTIRDLCNGDTGIPRIPDKNVQNRLLRSLMSVAPGERVPRHRLIRNLIEDDQFERAETEIRIFNKDFGDDGPVHRYKVELLIARATRTPGILEEDRVAILEQGIEVATRGVEKFTYNKNMLSTYAELSIEYYKRTKDISRFDDALKRLQIAEERTGDPEIGKAISRLERRMAGHFHDASVDSSD